MKIKLYTFDELLERRAKFVDDKQAYYIPREKYLEFSKSPQEVLYDSGTSFYIAERFYIPHSFVKEIIE